jgi:hypothetical protein
MGTHRVVVVVFVLVLCGTVLKVNQKRDFFRGVGVFLFEGGDPPEPLRISEPYGNTVQLVSSKGPYRGHKGH